MIYKVFEKVGKVLLFLFISFLGFACGNTAEKERVETNNKKSEIASDSLKQEENLKAFDESFKLENYLLKSLQNNDFITVSESAGIFISPDSLQIDKMKKSNGEETFYIIADDNIYYEYEASEFLKEKNIKVINPATRYIKFIAKGKEFYFDTKSQASIGWTAVLFSPSKPAPKIINPVDIEQEFEEYFK